MEPLCHIEDLEIVMIQGKDSGKFFIGFFRVSPEMRLILSDEVEDEGLRNALRSVQNLLEHAQKSFPRKITPDLIYEIIGELQRHQRVRVSDIVLSPSAT
ncbi:MAG: hypothetical protein V4697_00645 [Patescibacteria group bacterium]